MWEDDWYDEDSLGSDFPEESNNIWTQDKSGEFDINKRFEANLNPDVSNNQWFRNAYEPRWDTPAARQFLKENAADLEKKGAFISSEFEKGNIQPFLDHQQSLRDQGLFPTDAEPISARVSSWLNQKNIDEGLGESSLNYHDAFSHAYPDKFFGPVDTTDVGLTSVTGAEEGRASMLDFTLGNDGSVINEDMHGYSKDWDAVDRPELYKTIKRYSSPSYEDIDAEVNYWSGKYMTELEELAKTSDNPLYKNPYGTFRELREDTIVGGPYDEDLSVAGRSKSSKPSIYDSFREGARARYPGYSDHRGYWDHDSDYMSPERIRKIAEESIIPYGRDITIANKLQLVPRATQDVSRPTTPGAVKGAQDLWTNTYFAVSPDMAAAKLLADNWRGAAVGAGASLLNPEVATKAKEGDYLGATGEFGKDVALGSLTESGLKGAGNLAQRFAPGVAAKAAPWVGGALNIVGPGIVGAGLFGQGRTDSLTDLAAKGTIGKINPYSGTANAQDWEHLGRAQQAREKGGKWKIGGMKIPEAGLSEYLGFN